MPWFPVKLSAYELHNNYYHKIIIFIIFLTYGVLVYSWNGVLHGVLLERDLVALTDMLAQEVLVASWKYLSPRHNFRIQRA